MKRLSLLLVLSMLGVLVAAPSVQAAESSPFAGAWTATDPVNPGDGSTLYLTISGGTTVNITFIDAYGTICTNADFGYDSPTNWFSSRLTGSVSDDTLVASYVSARCGPLVFDVSEWGEATWTYDSATDTLFTDNPEPFTDTTWYRH